MKKPTVLRSAALCMLAAISSADTLAQASDSWKWQGSVYVYLPSIGGSTAFPQSGTGSSVTVDGDTILENLKFTFMGSLEATKGGHGFFTDVIYMDLGNTKSGYRDFTIGGVPVPGGATTNVSYDLKGWAWTLAGTWRLSSDQASKVDFLAGTRLFDMRQTLGWEVTGNVGPMPLPGATGESVAKISNWDAIIGVKGRFALGDGRWFVPFYADIGTGESDLTWQAMGGLGYSFKWGDVVGAYRYINYDMKSGKQIESMTFSGPSIAAVFHW